MANNKPGRPDNKSIGLEVYDATLPAVRVRKTQKDLLQKILEVDGRFNDYSDFIRYTISVYINTNQEMLSRSAKSKGGKSTIFVKHKK